MELQEIQISQRNLEKEEQSWKTHFPISKVTTKIWQSST